MLLLLLLKDAEEHTTPEHSALLVRRRDDCASVDPEMRADRRVAATVGGAHERDEPRAARLGRSRPHQRARLPTRQGRHLAQQRKRALDLLKRQARVEAQRLRARTALRRTQPGKSQTDL